jgi:hypothetical protein
MARTAPISGPLSFLIVALAAVFLNPGPTDRGHPGDPEPGVMVDEVGPPRPDSLGAGEPESLTFAEDTPPGPPITHGEAVGSIVASAGLEMAASEGDIREP